MSICPHSRRRDATPLACSQCAGAAVTRVRLGVPYGSIDGEIAAFADDGTIWIDPRVAPGGAWGSGKHAAARARGGRHGARARKAAACS